MIFYIFLLFLFILPGLVFNLGLYGTQGSTPLILKNVSFTYQTVLALIMALVINLPLVCMDYVYSDSFFMKQITTSQSSVTFFQLIDTVFYILITTFLGLMLGMFGKWIIKKFDLDRKFDLLKIDSPWYYLFEGYDWPTKPKSVVIIAQVELLNGIYIYTGLLKEYFFDNSGNLDRLVLNMVSRFSFKNGHTELLSQEDGFFVLKYSDIKCLNVDYITNDLAEIKE